MATSFNRRRQSAALGTLCADLDLVFAESLIESVEALTSLLEAPGEYYYEDTLMKRSLTGDSDSGPCEECDGNEAEGWIDSEDVYPSGDDGPPFHPSCVCEEEYKERRQRVYV